VSGNRSAELLPTGLQRWSGLLNQAKELSPNVIVRLKEEWSREYEQ
jgi:hypothetical protein